MFLEPGSTVLETLGAGGTASTLSTRSAPSSENATARLNCGGFAAEYPVHTERIEVWRYNPKDGPTPDSVEDYLVIENLARRVNVPSTYRCLPNARQSRTRQSYGSIFRSTCSSSNSSGTRTAGS